MSKLEAMKSLGIPNAHSVFQAIKFSLLLSNILRPLEYIPSQREYQSRCCDVKCWNILWELKCQACCINTKNPSVSLLCGYGRCNILSRDLTKPRVVLDVFSVVLAEMNFTFFRNINPFGCLEIYQRLWNFANPTAHALHSDVLRKTGSQSSLAMWSRGAIRRDEHGHASRMILWSAQPQWTSGHQGFRILLRRLGKRTAALTTPPMMTGRSNSKNRWKLLLTDSRRSCGLLTPMYMICGWSPIRAWHGVWKYYYDNIIHTVLAYLSYAWCEWRYWFFHIQSTSKGLGSLAPMWRLDSLASEGRALWLL